MAKPWSNRQCVLHARIIKAVELTAMEWDLSASEAVQVLDSVRHMANLRRLLNEKDRPKEN